LSGGSYKTLCFSNNEGISWEKQISPFVPSDKMPLAVYQASVVTGLYQKAVNASLLNTYLFATNSKATVAMTSKVPIQVK